MVLKCIIEKELTFLLQVDGGPVWHSGGEISFVYCQTILKIKAGVTFRIGLGWFNLLKLRILLL